MGGGGGGEVCGGESVGDVEVGEGSREMLGFRKTVGRAACGGYWPWW